MANKGRAPKPARLRLMNGARPADVNKNEPIPRTGRLVAPDWLTADERAVFDRVVSDLEFMRIDAPADVESLTTFATAVIAHRDATIRIRREGQILVGAHGNLVRNPATIVQRDSANQIRQLSQEFGLTPSARARIDTEKLADDEDNPFATAN